LGERAPIWDEHCRAVFFGLSRNTTKKELTKIVLEGIGFSARHIGKVINSFDISISKITLSGGLARIDAVSQIKSDIFGIPIIKLKSFETTSIGAAILCLVAVNEFSSMKEAFNSFASVEKIFEPDIKRYRIYDEFFELYVNVYESLSGPYKLRQTLSEKYYESISSGANFKDNL
jgi:xylulokinase